jgi:hypothetical protein
VEVIRKDDARKLGYPQCVDEFRTAKNFCFARIVEDGYLDDVLKFSVALKPAFISATISNDKPVSESTIWKIVTVELNTKGDGVAATVGGYCK